MTKKVIITGPPGVGKTTVFWKVVNELRNRGLVVGGFVCPEVRLEGRRVGFDIVDLATGKRGILSRVCLPSEVAPRVGRYCVKVREAEEIGVVALRWAVENAHIVAIDEIGPMEFKVPALRQAMFKVLLSDKDVLAVVHRRSVDNVSRALKGMARIYYLSLSNRDVIPSKIVHEFLD